MSVTEDKECFAIMVSAVHGAAAGLNSSLHLILAWNVCRKLYSSFCLQRETKRELSAGQLLELLLMMGCSLVESRNGSRMPEVELEWNGIGIRMDV